jgi:hypothetical protein
MTTETTRRQALECHGSWWGHRTGSAASGAWGQAAGTHSESPRSHGDSELRVSDAERQATADQLRAHFSAGRLDMDEYEERLQRAFGARTRRDLGDLVRDLPSTSTATGQPSRPRPVFVFAPRLTVIAVLAVLAVLTMTFGVANRFFFPWWIIPIGFFLLSRHWRRRWHPDNWGPAR